MLPTNGRRRFYVFSSIFYVYFIDKRTAPETLTRFGGTLTTSSRCSVWCVFNVSLWRHEAYPAPTPNMQRRFVTTPMGFCLARGDFLPFDYTKRYARAYDRGCHPIKLRIKTKTTTTNARRIMAITGLYRHQQSALNTVDDFYTDSGWIHTVAFPRPRYLAHFSQILNFQRASGSSRRSTFNEACDGNLQSC